jgi:hypothetical protein
VFLSIKLKVNIKYCAIKLLLTLYGNYLKISYAKK